MQNPSQGSGRKLTAHSKGSKRQFNDRTVGRVKGTNRVPPSRSLIGEIQLEARGARQVMPSLEVLSVKEQRKAERVGGRVGE